MTDPITGIIDEKTEIGFVTKLTDSLIKTYREVLNETDPDSALLVTRKYHIQNDSDKSSPDNTNSEKARRNRKNIRMSAYIKFWDSLNEEQQYSLSSHDAKINHLSRMARIIGTTEVVHAHNTINPSTAGSFDFVLQRFREEGVTARQLQKFIDENAIAWFSLTGHPTNPTTVAYTKAQLKVASVIADPDASPDTLKNALRQLRDTPIVGPRKTPLEEAEETLNTLDVIYDSALEHKHLLEAAIEKHGYAAEGVKVVNPLLSPCAWTLGDGDGNESLTAAVLAEGITLHRERISRRYAETCAAITAAAKKASVDAEILAKIEDLIQDISTPQCYNASKYAHTAEDIAQKIGAPAIASQLYDLSYLIRCFGTGFGKIDVRHNAQDIMTTITELFHVHKLMDKNRFSGLSMDEKSIMLSAWLKDDEVLQILAKTTSADIGAEPAAQRIFERLRVVGRNPDMCEKLIIAETAHPAHALAALLLLKVTGNEIGNERSRIDLVTLSESVSDLIGLGALLEDLLNDDSFRQHIASRKRLLVMIAKSDTTRQDGRGEAEFAQYESTVEVYRTADLMKQKYPELEPVLVSIKNGGGNALQRGGGRVTETPAVHGRAAADARVTDIGPSTLTIQGQQQSILFCPGKTAIGTLESLAAQNLYTKAGVRGEMQPPPFSKNINKQYARADARLYAKVAGNAFDMLVKNSSAIDELLVAAPWLSMKAGNLSSRPAKRGEKPVLPGITPAEANGDNPHALSGRAISGERLTAHACLPVFSVLGLLEAMKAVQNVGQACTNPKKYGDALHHLYRAHKIHRDAARATINAAAMADFDIAWPLLTNQQRPQKNNVEALARKFSFLSAPSSNTPEVTLAFLEKYFLDVEKLTYEMITGQKAKKTMRHGDALKKLWPELSRQVAQRDLTAEFSRVIECYRTRKLNAEATKPLTDNAFRITQALYAASNIISAPVGILATRTRLEPVQEIGATGKTRFMRPQSFLEHEVVHLLNIPQTLN